MVKRYLKKFFFIIIIAIFALGSVSCNSSFKNSSNTNDFSNSYQKFVSEIKQPDFKISDLRMTETEQRDYLEKYSKIVSSKNYTYTVIQRGIGENDQLSKIIRNQHDENFIEETIVAADDKHPDGQITQIYTDGNLIKKIDDGIEKIETTSSKNYNAKDNIANIIDATEFIVAYDVSNGYYCEEHKDDKNDYLLYFDSEGNLQAITYQASENIFLQYYILSFEHNK